MTLIHFTHRHRLPSLESLHRFTTFDLIAAHPTMGRNKGCNDIWRNRCDFSHLAQPPRRNQGEVWAGVRLPSSLFYDYYNKINWTNLSYVAVFVGKHSDRQNAFRYAPEKKVICVATSMEDVEDVGETLLAIAKRTVYYKPTTATKAGRYAIVGDRAYPVISGSGTRG